jgi:hypothetical protein
MHANWIHIWSKIMYLTQSAEEGGSCEKYLWLLKSTSLTFITVSQGEDYYTCMTSNRCGKGKGKGFPLQAWSGSWGSRRLRLLDLLDLRHYEGGKVVTLTHLPPYSILEAESTPGHMVPSVALEKIPSVAVLFKIHTGLKCSFVTVSTKNSLAPEL